MISQEMTHLGTARSAIRELFEYGKNRAAAVGPENVFDFSIGNPSVPPPPGVTAAALSLLTDRDPLSLHGYTSAQGDGDARAALAENLNRRFGTDYSPQNLYLTCGAAAALCCCFKALTCPGDTFLVFAPFFPEYKVFIRGAGGEVAVIPPRPEDFQINFSALEQALTPNVKGVVVNSPANPSGAVYSQETLTHLARLLTEKSRAYGHPIYLISDEPYREIVYDGTPVPWIPSLYPNTLVCYSYSKSLSLPGERIGYVLVPPQAEDWETLYAAICGAGRSMGYVNAPSLFQQVVAHCCRETADLGVYAANRRLLLDGLGELGFHCVPPGGTFYLFPRALEPDAVAFCKKAQALDLLLVPGDGFGCPGHFRLSFCVPTERITRALPIFAKLAEGYCTGRPWVKQQ